MKIHGVIYFLVGIFVVGFSYYITDSKDIDLQKFILFVWIGYLFIAIGAFKIMARMIMKPKPKLAKENFSHNRRSNSPRGMKFCSKCGSAVRSFDNFCFKCGSRQFRR